MLFLAEFVVSLTAGGSLSIVRQLVIVAIGALTLGIQNAGACHLAVPDITTTVLTMTPTGIGPDLRKTDLAAAGRRPITVLSMLLGAVVGAFLVLRLGVSAGIVAVSLALAVVLIGAAIVARGIPDWAVDAKSN